MAPTVLRALANLMSKIPLSISNAISSSQRKSLVIFPLQTIHFKGVDYKLSHTDATAIYSKLIYPKVKMLRVFAHQCCKNIFDRVFQYKIVTQLLPTTEYLTRYRVKDSNICHNCEIECDTIVHRLFDCETLSQIITTMLPFLKPIVTSPTVYQ